MSLNRARQYELQALWSVILGAVGGLAALAAAAFVLTAFDFGNFVILYSPKGFRFLAILGSVGVACLASAIGLAIGFNSAGQRLNKKSGLSWMGFFLSASVFVLAMCVFVLFWLTKFAA